MAAAARRNLASLSAPMPTSTTNAATPIATPMTNASAQRQASSAAYSRSVRWARNSRSTSFSCGEAGTGGGVDGTARCAAAGGVAGCGGRAGGGHRARPWAPCQPRRPSAAGHWQRWWPAVAAPPAPPPRTPPPPPKPESACQRVKVLGLEPRHPLQPGQGLPRLLKTWKRGGRGRLAAWRARTRRRPPRPAPSTPTSQSTILQPPASALAGAPAAVDGMVGKDTANARPVSSACAAASRCSLG